MNRRVKELKCLWQFLTLIFIASQTAWAEEASPGDIVPKASPPAVQKEIDSEVCMTCHDDPGETWHIDYEAFKRSTHGDHLCTSCHSDITENPEDKEHVVPLESVRCDRCHQLESEIYLHSDHRQLANRKENVSAACQSCHGDAHTLLNSRHPDSPVFRNNIAHTCGTCHQPDSAGAELPAKETQPVSSYYASVHGLAAVEGNVSAAVCTDCHGAHDLNRATNHRSKLYWQNIPKTCGKCHENIFKTFSASIHGAAVSSGKRDAPVCTDCHGEHTIDSVHAVTSKVYPSHIPETCGQCHTAERIISKYNLPSYVVETYMESYHGLAMQLGSVTAANCASCHGFHNILPHTDPRSSIHPDNLATTCGKCHSGVGELVTKGNIHSGRRPGLEHEISGFVRRFYLFLIFSVIGAMFLHNLMDFMRKLKRHYAKMSAQKKKERMGLSERLQHFVLAAAFIMLAYSGFALKYPQAWWAGPFAGHVDWRSIMHRAGAAMFGLLGVFHLWYMFFTSRGRWHLKELCPRVLDLVQCGQMIKYYVGLRAKKPVFRHYSYVEKLEYWALVWGSLIMGITGALILNQAWFLHHCPKWAFDVVTAIHYYEAILACLAILIWHGYFVMFDPEVYPMKWTWISGYGFKEDEERKS